MAPGASGSDAPACDYSARAVTCIVGTERWLCADRRITSTTGEKCPNERKLWRNAHLIVAGAGDNTKLHNVRRLVESGASDPRTLVAAVGDDSHCLVLTPDGKLWEVSEGAVYRRRRLHCIGSGGDLARGYLEGRPCTPENIRAAQRLASRLRDDCGGGVDLEGWG